MPIKILLPALSPTMKTGNLVKWLKKEQDIIRAGDVIAEVETDKATMEIEAVDEGVLVKIIVPEGSENVEVNSLIAVLLEEGEEDVDLENFINIENIKSSDLIANVEHNNSICITTNDSHNINTNIVSSYNNDLHPNKQLFASPIARKIATIEGIDLTKIVGSGPDGRVIKSDIEKILAHNIKSSVDTIEYQKKTNENFGSLWSNEYNIQDCRKVPHNNIRKITAKRLQEAKQQIPHFYLSIECQLDKLLSIRDEVNKALEIKNYKLSINDFIILAVANSLNDIKEVNASWDENSILYHNNIDISIAIATDHGLMTPILRNVDKKDIVAISQEVKTLAQKSKANRLKLEEFQGGGFTISNLGMYGIREFMAIINPPQSAILAVGSIDKKLVLLNNEIKEINVLILTLSCDHRVIDGAVAAKFLNVLKKYLEYPALMLL